MFPQQTTVQWVSTTLHLITWWRLSWACFSLTVTDVLQVGKRVSLFWFLFFHCWDQKNQNQGANWISFLFLRLWMPRYLRSLAIKLVLNVYIHIYRERNMSNQNISQSAQKPTVSLTCNGTRSTAKNVQCWVFNLKHDTCPHLSTRNVLKKTSVTW